MLPRVCHHIHGPNRRQSARCPYLLGGPGVPCRRAAGGVPMPPAVPPRLTVDVAAARAVPATPTRSLHLLERLVQCVAYLKRQCLHRL